MLKERKQMDIRPLIIVSAKYGSVSGGYLRVYEILKRGKNNGINYVIVTDKQSYANLVEMFPGYKEIFRQYRTYIINKRGCDNFSSLAFRLFNSVNRYSNYLLTAKQISKIAKDEDVDLIVGTSEGTEMVYLSFLAGKLSRKPWTTILQGEKEILMATSKLGPLNFISVFKHVSSKESIKKANFVSKIGYAIEVLSVLKFAEKSLMLTISQSLADELKLLNPKLKFYIIKPGNGIDLDKIYRKKGKNIKYDIAFFSRLIPEKGIFDLIRVTKLVSEKLPEIKVAVAGIIENQSYFKKFLKLIYNYKLEKNITFLGSLPHYAVFDLIDSSKLVVYPSTLDTHPLVVLESLACGKPVITYKIKAIEMNYGQCRAVLMCPVKDIKSMADIILSLFENYDLRVKLSEEARKFAMDYDWNNVIKAEKEGYFQVLRWFHFKYIKE
jgi:glycosyltransferase involved in cell wall biosynthesis